MCNGEEIQNALRNATNKTTTLFVFVKGKYVGGQKEIEDLYINGRLHHNFACIFCNQYLPCVFCCNQMIKV